MGRVSSVRRWVLSLTSSGSRQLCAPMGPLAGSGGRGNDARHPGEPVIDRSPPPTAAAAAPPPPDRPVSTAPVRRLPSYCTVPVRRLPHTVPYRSDGSLIPYRTGQTAPLTPYRTGQTAPSHCTVPVRRLPSDPNHRLSKKSMTRQSVPVMCRLTLTKYGCVGRHSFRRLLLW